MLPVKESEAKDFLVGMSILQAEVTKLVNELLVGKEMGVDEVHPMCFRSLDAMGVSWLTCLCKMHGSWEVYHWTGRQRW